MNIMHVLHCGYTIELIFLDFHAISRGELKMSRKKINKGDKKSWQVLFPLAMLNF